MLGRKFGNHRHESCNRLGSDISFYFFLLNSADFFFSVIEIMHAYNRKWGCIKSKKAEIIVPRFHRLEHPLFTF